MIETKDALEAWWPPTFRPSRLGRIWLALWIIHDDSQSTLRSSAFSTASRAARPSRSVSVVEETSVSGVGMIVTSRSREPSAGPREEACLSAAILSPLGEDPFASRAPDERIFDN